MLHDPQHTPAQDTQAHLARTFMFIEHAHEGQLRMRSNADGTPRTYVHHPLEVALLFAKMEVFKRKPEFSSLSQEQVADEIMRVVTLLSTMNKQKLECNVAKICKQLNQKQFIIVRGLLCHDTIESSYSRSMEDKEKNIRSRERLRQIKSFGHDVARVVVRLTDSRELPDKTAKKARQMQLAHNRAYAELKQYDILINMFDEALIPTSKRTNEEKRDTMSHMYSFMCVARSRGYISGAAHLAAQRMYAASLTRLSAA